MSDQAEARRGFSARLMLFWREKLRWDLNEEEEWLEAKRREAARGDRWSQSLGEIRAAGATVLIDRRDASRGGRRMEAEGRREGGRHSPEAKATMTSPSRARRREDPGEGAPGGTQETPGGIQGGSLERAQVQRASPSTCIPQDRQVSTVTNGSKASSTKRVQWKVERNRERIRELTTMGRDSRECTEEGRLRRCHCQALITEVCRLLEISFLQVVAALS